MPIMSTNFAKTLVWKNEYDVKLWRHKERTLSTNDQHMSLNETPHKNLLRTPMTSTQYRHDKEALGTTCIKNVKFNNDSLLVGILLYIET